MPSAFTVDQGLKTLLESTVFVFIASTAGGNMKPNLQRLLGLIAEEFKLAFTRGTIHRRPDHIGRPREIHIRRFLSEFLPPVYGIARGYIVYLRDYEAGIKAEVTSEFDAIIYRKSTCPNLVLDEETQTRLIPYEDVYGIIEAKSTLDEITLADALTKVSEIYKVSHFARHQQDSKEKRTQPISIIVAYRGSKHYGTKESGTGSLAERLDMNVWGNTVHPDAVFVLDREYVVKTSNVDALQRSAMVQSGVTYSDSSRDTKFIDQHHHSIAMEDHRGAVPDYVSALAKDGKAIADFYAITLGYLNQQRLRHYDTGELLSLMQID